MHKEKSIFNHNFAENVRILENNRRERSKSVFMNCYKALMEISYLLPSDIKILMGYEICVWILHLSIHYFIFIKISIILIKFIS